MTQQEKDRISNAIWILQAYREQIAELYSEGKLNRQIDVSSTFWDLKEIKKYMEE
jgi:hypothetical protein